MTEIVSIFEPKTNLSTLVDRAAAGEEIMIANPGKPKSKAGAVSAGPEKAPVWAEPARHYLHCR
jgi:antitoxin (DNA-binding transcriptional repressor) of toxin-antitoxin stability system